jgi:hypothetical protein
VADGGTVRLPADAPVTIRVAGASFEPPTIKGDYKTGTQATETRPETGPVPALVRWRPTRTPPSTRPST